MKRQARTYFQEGLSKEQRNPHDNVTETTVFVVLADHLQGNLNNHSQKEVGRNLSEGNRADEFMCQSRNQEGEEGSDRLRSLSIHLGLHIHVTQTPVVNRSVPLLPEFLPLIPSSLPNEHCLRIPPVLVEETIAELRHLGEDVQETVEDGEEEKQPDDETTDDISLERRRRERAAENADDHRGLRVGKNRVHELANRPDAFPPAS